jgi:glycerol-3-phosphate dehydrogenase
LREFARVADSRFAVLGEPAAMQVDVLIFGGGAAGLWLLDELARRGDRVLLLEAARLGAGQTIASQGIIHGGLKYTLHGALTPSAMQIREMPGLWRDCLAGRRLPDLRGVRLRAAACHLWRTDSLGSRLGMIGARVGLRVAPQVVSTDERPIALAGCPGTVARLDEPVLAPESLLAALVAGNARRVLHIDPSQLEIDRAAGTVRRVQLTDPATGRRLQIEPRHVVLTAGRGNADLRTRAGLPITVMQTRPLHMVLVRGDLPHLNGHCVDGRTTRVTITSDTERSDTGASDCDAAGRTVWQVGGQIAEIGVALDERSLLARAADELAAVIPGLDLQRVEWATYRVDRAEQAAPGGKRPESAGILHEGNVITAWPTKLALVPCLAERVLERLPAAAAGSATTGSATAGSADDAEIGDEWPRATIAPLPWEVSRTWYATRDLPRAARHAA